MIEDLFFDMARSKESLLREEVEMTRGSLEPWTGWCSRLSDWWRTGLTIPGLGSVQALQSVCSCSGGEGREVSEGVMLSGTE